MTRLKGTTTMTAYKMAKRICDRKDNVYDKRVIENILDMYMEECEKALLSGERVQITKVGTIIPEVKVHIGNFNLPVCNKEGGNPPYTKLRLRRNNLFGEAMNRKLLKNIENGIYGLENLSFITQQLNILKKGGYIPQDVEIEKGDEE